MAVGDIYQIKLTTDLGGAEALNVFYYQVTGQPGGAANAQRLFNHVEATLAPAIATVLQENVDITGAEVMQPGNPSDFYAASFDPVISGERTGETISNIVCWSFRYERIIPGQRSGWKRFSGLSESDVSGQDPTTAMETVLADLADELESDLGASWAIYSPVIVKHPVVLGTTPTVSFLVNTVSFAGVGSQVSRKRPFSAE